MESMFDLLRAKVEAEVSHPAVVVITSATNRDGSEVAARALAESLAATGYSTLLVDACGDAKGVLRPAEGYPLDEIGRRAIATESSSKLTVVTIGESVQRRTNQRHIKVAFESFRDKFDYTVISAGFRSSNPFAATVVAVANAVLVSIRIDRRQTRDDTRLAAYLNRLGPRFLGLISMTQATMDKDKTEAWRAPMPQIEKSIGRREAAEWPT